MVDGRISRQGILAISAPMLVHHLHPLATVNDVFNGVMLQGATNGNVMFYGQGTGKMPTASSVVTDIADIAKHLDKHIVHHWTSAKNTVLPVEGYITRKMLRVSYTSKENLLGALEGARVLTLPGHHGFMAWITPPQTETQTQAETARLAQLPGVVKVERMVRIYDPDAVDATVRKAMLS
jgi:homoserine dehydrogenase